MSAHTKISETKEPFNITLLHTISVANKPILLHKNSVTKTPVFCIKVLEPNSLLRYFSTQFSNQQPILYTNIQQTKRLIFCIKNQHQKSLKFQQQAVIFSIKFSNQKAYFLHKKSSPKKLKISATSRHFQREFQQPKGLFSA